MINNKILALKYRPQEFEDLIGQEAITQTIINGIELEKTPNAYLLTGIRGVGKTTTARLIAKALNCLKNFEKDKKCTKENFCESCQEIINSNHIDILEMDAASKTGIDDVRELIENSKYSPTSAKFKIFIIDEVHMLSKQAFNGLLKTLEEPPPRLKFILATTEVKKIPVTILSRCQRFDLKRVDSSKLLDHLKKILKLEKGRISEEALKLIVRTSEGSVRDAISLLDRALISQPSKSDTEITEKKVREMLGLADRSKLLTLLKEVLLGDQKKSISHLKDLIESGLDAKIFLNDILEILYLFSRSINLGPIEKDMMVSESETKVINDYAKSLDMQDIGLFWQLTIKTLDDLKIVANENLTLEMYVMQLIHLKNIEIREEDNFESANTKDLKTMENSTTINTGNVLDEKNVTSSAKKQLRNTNQIKENESFSSPVLKNSIDSKYQIKNFDELIYVANKEKEVELRFDLERNVKLVSFENKKIDISFNEKLNKNFIKNLTEKLLRWTGDRWIISLSKIEGKKTFYEKNLEVKTNNLKNENNSDTAKKLLSSFPDAKLIDVKEDDD